MFLSIKSFSITVAEVVDRLKKQRHFVDHFTIDQARFPSSSGPFWKSLGRKLQLKLTNVIAAVLHQQQY